MPISSSLSGFLKKIAFIIVIVAIVIPIRYGSTNGKYLVARLMHSALSIKHSIILDQARPTLSAEYRAFEEILRMKPVMEIDISGDPVVVVKNMRASFAEKDFGTKPSTCSITKEIFEHDGHTVDGYWVNNHQRNFQGYTDHFMIYMHGGAYLIGDINFFTETECHYSQLFNIPVLHVEYRLCPEYPLPAAVEDTSTIYRALLFHQNISSSQLIFMGDSSGGGLVLLTIQSLIADQLPVPRGAIVISPWTDLSASGESHQRNRHTDVIINSDNSDWMVAQILGPNHTELSANSSVFSPLFGSFEKFPPMYINVGTAEVLEDDAKRVFLKAKEAGVDVTLEEGLHMMHTYPTFFLFFPEAKNTLNNIKEWTEKLLF